MRGSTKQTETAVDLPTGRRTAPNRWKLAVPQRGQHYTAAKRTELGTSGLLLGACLLTSVCLVVSACHGLLVLVAAVHRRLATLVHR
jgi:hypothetical protein